MKKHLPAAITVVVCLLLGIAAAVHSTRELRAEREGAQAAGPPTSLASDVPGKLPVPKFDVSLNSSRRITGLLDPSSRIYDPRAALVIQSAKDLFEREPLRSF